MIIQKSNKKRQFKELSHEEKTHNQIHRVRLNKDEIRDKKVSSKHKKNTAVKEIKT